MNLFTEIYSPGLRCLSLRVHRLEVHLLTSWTDCARKVKSLFFDNIATVCNVIANALVCMCMCLTDWLTEWGLMTEVTRHKGSTDHLQVSKIEIHKTQHDILARRTKNTTTISTYKNTQVKLKLRSRLKYTVFSLVNAVQSTFKSIYIRCFFYRAYTAAKICGVLFRSSLGFKLNQIKAQSAISHGRIGGLYRTYLFLLFYRFCDFCISNV